MPVIRIGEDIAINQPGYVPPPVGYAPPPATEGELTEEAAGRVIDEFPTPPSTPPGYSPPPAGQPRDEPPAPTTPDRGTGVEWLDEILSGDMYKNGLDAFFAQLSGANQQFLNNETFAGIQQGVSGLGAQLAGLQHTQANIAGGADPRFEAYKTAQLQQLAADQQAQQARQSEFFSRRGLGGSSAALNQMNRLETGFGQQKQNLAATIGMQQLGRQDQALLNQQNILGQRAGLAQLMGGLEETRLGQVTAGLENLTIGEQLAIARLAAENAGQNVGGSGGGTDAITSTITAFTDIIKGLFD